MESKIIMNAFHHVTWGGPIAIYFFLLGISIGSYILSTLGWVFGIDKYKPVGLLSSLFSIFALLIIPPLILIPDLGKPFRFFYLLLPAYWHGTSPMAWGTVFLMLYTLFIIVYTWFIYKKNEGMARICGIAGIIFAVAMAWYSGVILHLAPGRSLTHTATAPLLSLIGALISGISALIILFWLKNLFRIGKAVDTSLIMDTGKILMYFIAFEVLLTFNEFVRLVYGTNAEYTYLKYVMLDVMKTYYYWLNEVSLMAALIIIAFTPLKRTVGGIVFVSFLALLAILGMRHWWVYGGQYLQTFF